MELADSTRSPGLVIVIPIYNDWEAADLLLRQLDDTLAGEGLRADALLVDDGSTSEPGEAFGLTCGRSLDRVDILALRRNLGHQRAIAIGLAYAHEHLQPEAIVVMDGDGEDAPSDVPKLLQRWRETSGRAVVFAERTKRSESTAFRVFYNLYRVVHHWLTGIPVRVGNFSVVPARQLRRLVVVSELWNHYAAAVFTARLPRELVPTERATRLSGQSRMNFPALIGHGLSALSVHAEVIGVRLLILTLVVVGVISSLLVAVFVVRLSTSLAIPGWATTAAGILLVLLFQAVAFAAAFVFLVLHSRSQPLFLPIRDYPFFVAGCRPVRGRAADSEATREVTR